METTQNTLQQQDISHEQLFQNTPETAAQQPTPAPTYDPDELERIVAVIRQAAEPEQVVLFGTLAGATPFSEMAAYDLLVVTQQQPPITGEELRIHLKLKLPNRTRAIPFINLYLYSATEAANRMKWLTRMALSEGKVLYSRKNAVRKPCDYEQLYFAAADRYNLFSGQAGGFLAAAGKCLAVGNFRQAAFHTACTAEMLLHALYGVYHAADTDLHTLTTLHLRVRTLSAELFLLLDPEQCCNSRMLSRLDVYRRDALFRLRCDPQGDEIGEYVQRAGKMKQLVERLCCDRLALYAERSKS